MSNRVAVLFTAKSTERILREGGTSSWRLDRNHARKCEFAVCVRNAKADWVEGPEAHHSAFLVGKVADVVPVPTDRYLIQFSEYAIVNVAEVWKGDRNPVRYAESLSELRIDPSTLDWLPMPAETEAPDAASPDAATPLTIPEAKRGLALTFGVPPEAIEITIRG